ncbi:hypothetical protein Tco_1370474 [Tanacetum coccineum]
MRTRGDLQRVLKVIRRNLTHKAQYYEDQYPQEDKEMLYHIRSMSGDYSFYENKDKKMIDWRYSREDEDRKTTSKLCKMVVECSDQAGSQFP